MNALDTDLQDLDMSSQVDILIYFWTPTVYRRHKGAWVKLDELKQAGNLIDAQPLHDKAAIENLLKRWRRLTFTTIAGQPFSEFRDYFGEVRFRVFGFGV